MNYTFGSPGNFFMESVTHFQNELFISFHFEFIRHAWLFLSMALILSFWQSVDRKGASTDLQVFCLSSSNTLRICETEKYAATLNQVQQVFDEKQLRIWVWARLTETS